MEAATTARMVATSLPRPPSPALTALLGRKALARSAARHSRATVALSLTIDLAVILLDDAELIEDGGPGELYRVVLELHDVVRRDVGVSVVVPNLLFECRVCLDAFLNDAVPIVLGCTEAAHGPTQVVVDLKSFGGSVLVTGVLVHVPCCVDNCTLECV